MSISLDFKDKVAIVTGGSRGIGYGICSRLVDAGARVVSVDILKDEAVAAADSLNAAGGHASCKIVDASDVAAMDSMFHDVVSEYGKIDLLVNNAGVMRRTSTFEVTEQDYDFVMDINLRGVFFSSLNCGRIMIRQGFGCIVNVSSTSAFRAEGNPPLTVYGITKVGILHMTKYLAREFAPHGVRINSIAPSYTRTEINRDYDDRHPEVLAAKLKYIPMGRGGLPEDMGNAVVFLASDLASFITGHTLPVDGGMLVN